MPSSEIQDCTIQYYPDMIVLDGATQAIHTEASRILRQFAYSALPLQMKRDTAHRVILTQRH